MTTRNVQPEFRMVTPHGRGAIATIVLSGEDGIVIEAFNRHFRRAGSNQTGFPLNRILYGTWGRQVPEDVVVCRTDEDCIELHCHGGQAAIGRITTDLECFGIRRSESDSVACIAEDDTRLHRDLSRALINAPTFRTAEILLQQSAGLLRSALEDALDSDRRVARLEQLLLRAEFGVGLTRFRTVVLAGRPNVGKSSLMNALAGFFRSIVFDEPGTTRDAVTLRTAFDGWPVELIDTAGIHDAISEVEREGVSRARERMNTADCVCILIDRSEPLCRDDRELLDAWPNAVVVAHKSDLADICGKDLPSTALPVSSLTRDGIDALVRELVDTLIPDVPAPGTALPINAYQVDLIRQALEATRQGADDIAVQLIRSCIE